MMMSGRMFCAALFVMAIASFVIGAVELIQYIDFQQNARTATATLAERISEPQSTRIAAGGRRNQYMLKFRTDTGVDVYATPSITASMEKSLLEIGTVEVTYLASNPRRIVLSADEFSLGIIWFALGLVLSVVSFWALRLFRAESG